MKSLILLALVAFATAMPLADEWESFKKTFEKSYETDQEEQHRNKIWLANKEFIDNHNANAEKHGYSLKMNGLGDMENHEINAMLNGYRMRQHNSTRMFVPSADFVPDAAGVDWREKGAVTPIKNQGQCGSCWSFSTTGSLEGQHFLKKGELVSLSEQNLVDCSTKYGNHGCEGGLMDNAFKYIKANDGIDTEASYPYQAHNEPCRFKIADVGATITGYTDIPHGNEKALTEAIHKIGPISVAMDASKSTFHYYHAGIYSDPQCSSVHLDHGVLAVGYGIDLGQGYYIVKNSWGTAWGIDGYFLLARDDLNMCGIATQASYPLV